MLNDVEFREAQEMAKVDKVKIVACDGKSEFALSQTINAIMTSILQSRVGCELQRTCSCTRSTSVQYEEHSITILTVLIVCMLYCTGTVLHVQFMAVFLSSC